ncbi:MAG: PAS domain S-box protein [Gammaproteobacteria bacterium]|nr:PAS domain S-box protein [Gammaproteobacteria bacterium]
MIDGETERGERLRAWEDRALGAIAAGAPLKEVLEQIVCGIEDVLPQAIGSILLVDPDGVHLRHGAAPHLPPAFVAAIDGLASGPAVGSCGTAAYRRRAVIVTDIDSDPLWADYRELARASGLRACWSLPVRDVGGQVLATFAVYYRAPRAPRAGDLAQIRNLVHIVAVAVQVERKARLLQASEQRFRKVFADAVIGIAVADAQGRFLEANAAYCAIFGYTEVELQDSDLRTVIHPEDRATVQRFWDDLSAGRRDSYQTERRGFKKTGELVWVRISAAAQRDEAGRLVQVVAVAEDITAYKRTLEELRQNQALLRMASRINRLGAWAVELPSRTLVTSKALRQWLAVTRGGIRSLDQAIAVFAPEHQVMLRQAVEACAGTGESFDLTQQLVAADRRPMWVRILGEAVRDVDGRITRVQGTLQDVTQEREAQAQLRLLQAAVSHLNDIVLITEAEPIDEPGPRIVFVNDAFERHTGYTRAQALGKTPRLLQGPKTRRAELDRIRAAIERRRPVLAEVLNYTRDGKELWLELAVVPVNDDSGRCTHLVAIQRNVTERRQLEERLRGAERLEAVGQLTGGVAHDFNNLLTVILGNAELLHERLGEDPQLAESTAMIADAAQRGADLTQRLLAFARRQPLDPRPMDVRQLIQRMEGLLRRSLGEQVEICFQQDAKLWPALIDPGQLENALLNLAINARDAMPNGGRLTVETSNAYLDADYAVRHSELKPGEYVMVAVSDTGIGIRPEHLGRIFEPFFTTKPRGKGTGLGLAMVYGFVKQSGGHVNIYSELGQGTTVKIYLPRADRADPAAAVPTTSLRGSIGAEATPSQQDEVATGATRPRNDGRGGTETILLVEDDDLVRRYALDQLRALGYRVFEASDAAQALDILRQHAVIELLFTDVVMPGGTSGRQLAEAAVKLHPRLKVLFTSGYTENAIVHHGRLDPGVQLLAKPYRGVELGRRVRRVLDLEDGKRGA